METAHNKALFVGSKRRTIESPPFFVKKTATHCGQAKDVLSQEVKNWMKHCLGCIAGRREFMADRYFAVEVRELSDVIGGWRHFVRALERRETVACLYVVPEPGAVLRQAPAAGTDENALTKMSALSEIMSLLSDQSSDVLLHGGQLNFVINLSCPITACRTPFCDFDAVAFVPEANNPSDALYDPLMAAPVPMVNINSDIYGFSMFTRDHALSLFDCEVTQLTKRERHYLFEHAAETWQRIAERTIENYAKMVDQTLCPTYLTENREFWIANHKDPAFAETQKKSYCHEMPVHYTRRVVAQWEEFFERGRVPVFRDVSMEGREPATGCPFHAARKKL